MPWTIDEKKGLKNYHINNMRQLEQKYEDWKNRITTFNLTPMEAANQIGDTNFEELSGQNRGEFTIRLSQAHRVAFTIDTPRRIVSVFQVGDHYPKKKK